MNLETRKKKEDQPQEKKDEDDRKKTTMDRTSDRMVVAGLQSVYVLLSLLLCSLNPW